MSIVFDIGYRTRYNGEVIRDNLSAGEYYHVCHRGNNKQPIFFDEDDRIRLLFLLLFYQAPFAIDNINRLIKDFKSFVRHPTSNNMSGSLLQLRDKVLHRRMVELICFTLMTNHFHLALYAKSDDGISRYMQKVLIAFTKYINTKYERSGHLFQGPYSMVHQADNDQFLYLGTYIHRNVRELSGWKSREHEYPWSSYQDYIHGNRWGELLAIQHIMEQFASQYEYKQFTEESPAKLEDVDE